MAQQAITIPGLPDPAGLNQDAIARVVDGINLLTHERGHGAGEPFNLRPWQTAILAELFGRLRPDGKRQYRTCYIEIPRKNGKTELAAAVTTYMLCGDGEQGAEVIGAAAEREQAGHVFRATRHMVESNPALSKQCKVIASQKRIVHYPTGSYYKAVSAEAYSKHGHNCSAVIYDELHAAPDRELYDVLTTSMGARVQPLMLVITTAGWDRTSICWEVHDYATRILEGRLEDDTFLPIIFAADQDADWTDEAVWHGCNPALGDFRSLEEMRIEAKRSKEILAKQNSFRRLYLNQWTEQDERWLDMSVWDACGGEVDVADLTGMSCYAGLDLASTRDVTAFVLVFPNEETDEVMVLPFFWIPEESVAKRAREAQVPYDVWIREGFMRVTEGNVCDYDRIREDIREMAEVFDIHEIAYDRWGATQLVTQLEADGAECAPLGQGFASMSGPMKELDKLIAGQRLVHGGHPVLRWMAGNVAVEQDAAGNLKPSKKRSREKIDGVVALVMAVDRMSRYLNEPSVYDSDDAEVFVV